MPSAVYRTVLQAPALRVLALLMLLSSAPACAESPPQAQPEAPPSSRRAVELWQMGDREGAIREYERLEAGGTASADDRQSLALLLLERGGPAAAAVDLSQLVDPSAEWVAPLWSGVQALEAGQLLEARRQLAAAVAASPEEHLPYAHYLLGSAALRAGEPAQAVAAFERALRQDPAITDAFQPLAQALWDLGRYAEARDRLRRARISRPWDTAIVAQLAAWEAERPGSPEEARRRAQQRREQAQPPRVAPPPAAATAGPLVRVGLAEGLQSVWLKTGGAALVSEDGEAVLRLDEAATLRVAYQESRITLTNAAGEELHQGPGVLRVSYADPTFTSTIFDLTFGSGQFRSGQEDRSYRGGIELLPINGGLTVVNELGVDEYLYSVVPSEMPALWPQAALEAQAIAARSYTLYPRNRFSERGFDLLSSVSSAYYPGVTNEHPRTTAAVDATRGVVLRDGRRPLDAVYSANSAGYGEAAGSVWGWPNSLVATSDPLLPNLDEPRSPAELWAWLGDRPDSYAARQPFSAMSAYRWILVVPREAIEARLAAAGIDVGRLRALTPRARGITGRVESVTVTGSDGSAEVRRDLIRSRLGGLRSNLFMVAPYPPAADEPTSFVFLGAGWGHGVGMCQTGAAGMAADGYTAEEILAVYYPRNAIADWY